MLNFLGINIIFDIIYCMKSKQTLFIILFFFFAFSGFSQSVKVLEKTDKTNLPIGKDFSYIEAGLDTSKLQFTGTFEATGFRENSWISELFNVIKTNAQSAGANSFVLISFSEDFKKNISTLVLKTYMMNDSTLKLNNSKHEKNTIYVFSSEKLDTTSFEGFYLNSIFIKLKTGKYFRKETNLKEAIKLSNGYGGSGTYDYKRDNEIPNMYITLARFGNGGSGVSGFYGSSNSIGIRFGAEGRGLYFLDTNIGILMSKILKQSAGIIRPPKP